MKTLGMTITAAALALATPALAEFQQVKDRSEFVALMSGKTLSRPFVKLQVSPDGRISGRGAAWDVSGQWQWKGGYLCRTLEWGGDDLGYNCQEVKVSGNKVRITSDRGAGQSADFRLQ
ncbi:MAG: dihydrodipicolinate reductase [Sulfitobacter sp.]|nr:dihydrodipicolinate reductase [Sulfitobacter sp.]